MKRSDYMAFKSSFYEKYSRRYEETINAGISKEIIDSMKTDLDDQYPHVYRKDGSTGTISVYGPMSPDGPDWIDLYLGYGGVAYKNLIRASKEILNDDEIDNVTVYINTGGGYIEMLDEAREWLKKVSDSGKTVTVINKGSIASAGVWYASAADRVIGLNSSVMIGSIGVAIDTMDFTGYYDALGIKEISLTNTASPNKRPDITTKSGQNIYIKELDALYGVFVDRVTGGRAVSPESIKALKGEMLIAAEAVKIGLMDGIEGDNYAVSEPKTQKTEKTTKKETIKMDEELKKALDNITGSISALSGRLEKIEGNSTKEETELSAEDKKFALNIITGATYSATVIAEAGKVLAGDANIATLKAMTAAVDAVTQKAEGTEAAAATAATGETPPKGEVAPGAKKPDNGVLDDNPAAIEEETKRIKGGA